MSGIKLGTRCLAPVVLLATLALASAGEPELGAVALRNEWNAEGGSFARNGATLTPPLRGPVEVAWTYEPKKGATLVGEPLAFHQWACVEEDRGASRALVFLRVHDGAVIDEVEFQTDADLQASHADGLVVVRSGPSEVAAFAVRAGKVSEESRLDLRGAVGAVLSAPSAKGESGAFLAAVDGGLFLGDVRSGGSLWSRPPGARVTGHLSIRRGTVFMLAPTSVSAELISVDRASGHIRSKEGLGYDTARGPCRHGDSRISVFEENVVVGNVGTAGGDHLFFDMPLRRSGATYSLGTDIGLLSGPGRPAVAGASWICVLDDDASNGVRLARDGEDRSFYVLARSASGAEVLHSSLYPVRAGGVLYLGPYAVAGDDLTVLWVAPVEGTPRIVPARRRVLYQTPSRLVAVGHVRGEGPRVRIVDARAEPFKGAAVTEGGDVLEGTVTLDAEARTLSVGRTQFALDDVSLVLDANGAVVALASGEEAEDALISLSRYRRGLRLADLALDAASARAPELLDQLVARATALGGPESKLRKAAQKRAGIAKLKSAKLNESLRDKTRDAAAPYLHGDDGALADVYRALPDDTPGEVRLDLLRLLVEGGAAAEFKGDVLPFLPETLRPDGDFDPRAWLEVADAVRGVDVTIVDPPKADTADLTPGDRTLGALSHSWRHDLRGVRSPQLLVVSPLAKPGALGLAISMGELVCDRLEKTFAAGERDRSSRYPLTLLLYDTEDAYRERTREKGASAHTSEFSVGHYASNEELSHMYLPDDAEAFRAVMPTFAHELTHQWIAERCPLFSGADMKRGGDDPGYWIVEGFATMIEERMFDLSARTWAFDPFAGSITTVRALAGKALLPWERLFGITHKDVEELGHEFEIPVSGGRRLARGGRLSEVNVFYDQAGAVCHYLFEADGGALREKLVTFVGLHYTGKTPTIQEHFGMTAEQLGAKVVAWARAQRR